MRDAAAERLARAEAKADAIVEKARKEKQLAHEKAATIHDAAKAEKLRVDSTIQLLKAEDEAARLLDEAKDEKISKKYYALLYGCGYQAGRNIQFVDASMKVQRKKQEVRDLANSVMTEDEACDYIGAGGDGRRIP